MGIYKVEPNEIIEKVINGEVERLIRKDKWNQFNSTLLGMGDIGQPSKVISAICAVFDMEGFTSFCTQIDPQLSTPTFLNHFLDWFFERIQAETLAQEHPEGIEVWHNLPLLIKFMGDGMMVVWDTEGMSSLNQANIIVSCKEICKTYTKEFYPFICQKVSGAPKKFRCGVAKGNIFSVGNGNDFVGPSINFASRLQKLPGCGFAFSDRGFSVQKYWDSEQLDRIVFKKTRVRGIGDYELVCIFRSDLEKMTPEEKAFYTEP
jgi:hypothetical protein